MDESEISPNRHVIVSIVGREIEEKVPLKPLILTPPGKIVNNCLPLGLYWQFFLRTHPRHHQKNEQVKTASRNKMFIKFIFLSMDG